MIVQLLFQILPHIKKKTKADKRFLHEDVQAHNKKVKALKDAQKTAMQAADTARHSKPNIKALEAKHKEEMMELGNQRPDYEKKPIKIGVFYCGAPVIANMINIACTKYSDEKNDDEGGLLQRKVEFVFHEEHF